MGFPLHKLFPYSLYDGEDSSILGTVRNAWWWNLLFFWIGDLCSTERCGMLFSPWSWGSMDPPKTYHSNTFHSPQEVWDDRMSRVKSPYIVDGHPTFNDGNPYNGYIIILAIGLMSLSPIWKSCELIDPSFFTLDRPILSTPMAPWKVPSQSDIPSDFPTSFAC